jgi:hypothetical protein
VLREEDDDIDVENSDVAVWVTEPAVLRYEVTSMTLVDCCIDDSIS